jgi:hypothetical protein
MNKCSDRRIVAELDALQGEVDALKRLQAKTAAEVHLFWLKHKTEGSNEDHRNKLSEK